MLSTISINLIGKADKADTESKPIFFHIVAVTQQPTRLFPQ